MKPEIYLDHLVRMRERGEYLPAAIEDDIAASLAAGERLSQLQEIQVPSNFARNLESSLRLRARTYNQTRQNSNNILQAHPRIPGTLQRARTRQGWMAASGVAVLLVLAFTVLMTVIRSLPGTSLPNQKQAVQQRTSTVVSTSQIRANNDINQLSSTITNLSQVVNERQSDDAIQQTLQRVVTATQNSQEAVKALPAGPEHDKAQQNLDNALTSEKQTLYHLLKAVDWSMKLIFTQQLGSLGNPVPEVTHVSTQYQKNGTWLIVLTGANFASDARLIIDGQFKGSVSQVNAKQLIAVISNIKEFSDTHTFGILNPDGTGAQMTFKSDDDDQQGSDPDD